MLELAWLSEVTSTCGIYSSGLLSRDYSPQDQKLALPYGTVLE